MHTNFECKELFFTGSQVLNAVAIEYYRFKILKLISQIEILRIDWILNSWSLVKTGLDMNDKYSTFTMTIIYTRHTTITS